MIHLLITPPKSCLPLIYIVLSIGASFALLKLNQYPAKVFVGDVYCYWMGMTMAVAAIEGHYSKTLMALMLI